MINNPRVTTNGSNTRNGIKMINETGPLKKLDWPGPSVGNSKLSPEEIVEIRKLWEAGEHNQIMLANKFGVHRTTINRIIRRETWSS